MSTQAEKAETLRALHHRTSRSFCRTRGMYRARAYSRTRASPRSPPPARGSWSPWGTGTAKRCPVASLRRQSAGLRAGLSLPLTADVVSGYGSTPRAAVTTVRMMLEKGAVGINLEDLGPSGKGLVPDGRQVQKIKAIRRLGESMGIPLVINARTDALSASPRR